MKISDKIREFFKNPLRLFYHVIAFFYNIFITKKDNCILKKEYAITVADRCSKRNDISDHLEAIFIESLLKRPKLIVELGVRGGQTLYVFERVSRLTDCHIISVDIDDCSHLLDHGKWHFVKSDDIEFSKGFVKYCEELGIEPLIDILFIDTSHLYDHTKKEIESWIGFMKKGGCVIFHDTNSRFIYKRKDGSLGVGCPNKRGVIRAIQEHFKIQFDERKDITMIIDNWKIKHYSNCSGLTVIQKLN